MYGFLFSVQLSLVFHVGQYSSYALLFFTWVINVSLNVTETLISRCLARVGLQTLLNQPNL